MAALLVGCDASSKSSPLASDEKDSPAAAPAANSGKHETSDVAKEPVGLSSAMSDGRCETQADCKKGSVCVAVTPGVAECISGFKGEVPSAAPNGRPAPPIGLLDGEVLREHVRGGRQ